MSENICMHTKSYFLCESARMWLSLSRQLCPHPAEWSAPHCALMQVCGCEINNSECWHSWVEPRLFMVGIGTDRWLLLILRSSTHSLPPRNQAVINIRMSLSSVIYNPLLQHMHPTPPLPCPCSPDLCPLHLWASSCLSLSLCIVSLSISPHVSLSLLTLSADMQNVPENFRGLKCGSYIQLFKDNNGHRGSFIQCFFCFFFHVSCQNVFVSYFMQCLLVCQIHNV